MNPKPEYIVHEVELNFTKTHGGEDKLYSGPKGLEDPFRVTGRSTSPTTTRVMSTSAYPPLQANFHHVETNLALIVRSRRD